MGGQIGKGLNIWVWVGGEWDGNRLEGREGEGLREDEGWRGLDDAFPNEKSPVNLGEFPVK